MHTSLPAVFIPLLFSTLSVYSMENKSIQPWHTSVQHTKRIQQEAQSDLFKKNMSWIPTATDVMKTGQSAAHSSSDCCFSVHSLLL
jgi:hypothetical protein